MNVADGIPAARVFLSLVAQAKWCDNGSTFLYGLLAYWRSSLNDRERFALMAGAIATCVSLLDEAVELHDQAMAGGEAITAEALLCGLLQTTYEGGQP